MTVEQRHEWTKLVCNQRKKHPLFEEMEKIASFWNHGCDLLIKIPRLFANAGVGIGQQKQWLMNN